MTRYFLTLSLVLSVACGSTTTETATETEATTGGEGTETTPTAAETTATNECQLAPIYYGFDSSELDEGARAALAANARCLREAQQATIVGMTDEEGTEEYNLALGDRRARSAVDYLKALGVEEGRLQGQSLGEEFAAGHDDAARALDRRTEIRTQAH